VYATAFIACARPSWWMRTPEKSAPNACSIFRCTSRGIAVPLPAGGCA